MFNRRYSFNGPRYERPFRRGFFRYIILHHLKDKPSHGYEIMRALEKRSHGFYTPSPGTVYPTLQMLEEMGQVTSLEQDGKKVYAITNEGHRFLDEHKDFEERIENHLKDWLHSENSDDIAETMREFEKLAQLLSVKARTGDSEKLGRIRDVISRAYADISRD